MSEDSISVEMFRRALVQRNLQAWVWVQRTYRETVLNWLHRHPSRETACRLAGEDYYVSQAFERLWQATADNQKLAYMQSTALLEYLHTSLNSVVLDTLRDTSPPGWSASPPDRVPLLAPELPESGAYVPGDLTVKDPNASGTLWQTVQALLPDAREQRLAYLLYHCGLKPSEVVDRCSQEFSDMQEVTHLRRSILERLVLNADALSLLAR